MLFHDMQGARDAVEPRVESIKARASAAIISAASLTIHNAGDAGQPETPVAITTAPGAVVCTYTGTPKLTGRYLINCNAKITTDAGAAHTEQLSIWASQAPTALAQVASGEVVNVPTTGGAGGAITQDAIAFIWSAPAGAVAAGTPVTIQLRCTADANGHLTIAGGGAQITVQELAD